MADHGCGVVAPYGGIATPRWPPRRRHGSQKDPVVHSPDHPLRPNTRETCIRQPGFPSAGIPADADRLPLLGIRNMEKRAGQARPPPAAHILHGDGEDHISTRPRRDAAVLARQDINYLAKDNPATATTIILTTYSTWLKRTLYEDTEIVSTPHRKAQVLYTLSIPGIQTTLGSTSFSSEFS